MEALRIYQEAAGNFDVPRNYVCNEVEVVESMSVAEGLGLGEGEGEGGDVAESSDDSEVVKSLMDAIEGIEGLEGLGEDEDEDDDELSADLGVDEDSEGITGVGDDEEADISSLFSDIVAESEIAEEEQTKERIDFGSKFDGMKLGEIVWRLRIGDVGVKHDSEEKAMLDAIGFDWGETSKFIRAPFARTLCGLYAYKKIRGDLCVEMNFKIPSYDPWPSVLGDFELGKYVNQLRGQKALLQEEYPLKMQMLNQLNFLWLSKRKD